MISGMCTIKTLAFYYVSHVTCHTLSKKNVVVILLPDNTTISFIPELLWNIVHLSKQLSSAQVNSTRMGLWLLFQYREIEDTQMKKVNN
jgi:hypothetical protein